MGDVFSVVLCFFDVFWSLEIICSIILGVLGSSLDVFGAWGVQGGDLVELIRLHFGVIFGVKW